ncbi:L,D-transpeptidase [Stappia sp.]|uniref:L,D-transpeptidase n=1 Tax=Stappia sp. TaxID=1870903 RepID=UPI0025FDA735|nr:L,D-transpeptidase [Stappia sp.]|tara:strand:- start:263 stop:991 length:729 start_codon:yes stop_codon:yes gene_type:complete
MASNEDDLAGTGMLSRRAFVVGLPLVVAACQSTGVSTNTAASLTGASHPPLPGDDFDYAAAYAARTDYDFKVPAIPYKNFDRKYWRQVVDYDGGQPSGTVVVDPYSKFLYLVLPGGKALRYGIGVGKAGFAWSGDAKIRVKRVWPLWRPPREMIARNPHLEKYWKDGYPRGPKNPLGARALDLWQGSVDTLYRIHGTKQPSSIGRSVSSGCIRMWNQDVMDLFERVPTHTKVVVLSKAQKTS